MISQYDNFPIKVLNHLTNLIRLYPYSKLQSAKQLIIILSKKQTIPTINNILQEQAQFQCTKQNIVFKQLNNKSIMAIVDHNRVEHVKKQKNTFQKLNWLYILGLRKNIKIVCMVDPCDYEKQLQMVLDLLQQYFGIIIQNKLSSNSITLQQCIEIILTTHDDDELAQSPKKQDKNNGLNIKIENVLNKKIIKQNLNNLSKMKKQDFYDFLDSIKGFQINQKCMKFYSQQLTRRQPQIGNSITQFQQYFAKNTQKLIKFIQENVIDIFYSIQQNSNLIISTIIQNLPFVKLEGLVQQIIINKQDVLLNIVSLITSDFIQLYQKDNQNTDSPATICRPWEIIQIIFKYSKICNVTKLRESKIYIYGYLCKIIFQIFSQCPYFCDLNAYIAPCIYDIMLKLLEYVTQTALKWTDQINQQIIRPKKILQIANNLQNLINKLKYIITQPNPQIQLIKPELQNKRLYLEISQYIIKNRYFVKYEKNLNRVQKLGYIKQILQKYKILSIPINSIYSNQPNIFIKGIYRCLGNYLMQFNQYYYAIKIYQAANLLFQLSISCKTYLQFKLEEISLQYFLQLIDILVQLGQKQQAKKYLIQYQKYVKEQQESQLFQYLMDINNKDDLVDKLQFNNRIYRQNFISQIILDEDLLEQIIGFLNQKFNTQNNHCILLP